MVQWLGLSVFIAWVQYLVGELRSCKLHGMAKKKERKKGRKLKEIFYHQHIKCENVHPVRLLARVRE